VASSDTVFAESPTEVWREPPRGGYPDPALIGLSGHDRLRAWSRGLAPAPPLTRLTGAAITEVGSGTAGAEMPASGWLLSSAGVITGGTLAIVADIAFGCAVQTELPPATPYTTAELSLSFLRPARPDGTLSAGGQAIHVGRSVALSEMFLIEQDSDRLIAHGTSRCAVLPRVDPAPSGEVEPPELDEDTGSDPYRRPAPLDTVIAQEVFAGLSGREILDRQLRGELPPPPIHWLTGLDLVEVTEAVATMRLPCTKWLSSPATTVQGGVIAMLAEMTMLNAVLSKAPAGTAIAGLDLKVNYLRPVRPDGRDLVARASIIHSGRTIAVTSSEVENADGKPVALATGSAMYLPDRPANLGEVELGPTDEDQ
jgi:uncharacterized protein (TIGR00369 family)